MPWATSTSGATRSARLAAAGLLLALGGCGAPAGPSIVVVTIDTLRADHVGAYGDGRGLTPNLDALAAGGLVHERAYTTMPTTAPAHLSLFTGLLPSEHGGRRNGDPLRADLRDRAAPERLRRRGYATAAFVSTRLMARADTGLPGFEVYDAPTSVLRPGDKAVGAALAWLDAEPRRPVLLWVHLYDPHAPYGSADEKRRSFPVEPAEYGFVDAQRYGEPAQRREMAERYARGVRAADAALGRLLEGVRQRIQPPPLVLFAADHGESLAEHLDQRGYAYDHGKYLDAETVEIPLVIAGQGVAPGRSRGAASIRDLYTTALEAAGVGDDDAAAEGRRDLRTPDDAPRQVRIERRAFGSVAGLPESILSHAAAAADGTRLVIVAADGSPSAGDPGAVELLALARRGLVEAAETARPLSPQAREALRQLGYLE